MEDFWISRNINICFLSGKIISEPEFDFFYNSKKYISKLSFVLQTENGFKSSKIRKETCIKVSAYNNIADFVYRYFNIYDIMEFQGFLTSDEVVITKVCRRKCQC